MDLEEAKERYARLKMRAKLLEAEAQRIQSRQSAAERKRDTRRKILAGVVALSAVRDGKIDNDLWKTLLDEYLTEDRDRELFGLNARDG